MTVGTERRMPLGQAQLLACQILDHLSPVCQRIEVAGSIRRRKETVKDIEIVAIPRNEPLFDLFGSVAGYRDLLHERVVQLKVDGIVTDRLDKNGRPSFGAKYKRLLWLGTPLDLFTATADTWGYVLTLRTGPADFSHRLVTPTYQGGYMPLGMKADGGQLWDGSKPVPTPEESDVFAALRLPYREPWERS